MARAQLIPALVLVAALARPAHAQDRQRDDRPPNVPAHLQPAAGMCRVWLKDVSPAQQPAPTECAVAIRNRPPDAVVLFGRDVTAGDARGMAPRWAARSSSFGPVGRSATTQGAQPTRIIGPEPAVTTTPQITPAKIVTPKPEKPQ